jgi:AcrR family transcriptional regulator
MSQNDWEEWVHYIAEQYDLDLKKKQTAKQKQILEAAIHIFAEKGYNGATTSEIAKRANVAEATIFKHYHSKKGLLLRLVLPAISKVVVPFALKPLFAILEEEKPANEIVEDLIKDRVELIEKNQKLVRVILVESLYHPELKETLVNHVIKANAPEVAKRVQRLKEKGVIRADLPDYVVISGFISTVLAYLISTNLFGFMGTEPDEQKIKYIADLFLNGVVPRPVDSKPT